MCEESSPAQRTKERARINTPHHLLQINLFHFPQLHNQEPNRPNSHLQLHLMHQSDRFSQKSKPTLENRNKYTQRAQNKPHLITKEKTSNQQQSLIYSHIILLSHLVQHCASLASATVTVKQGIHPVIHMMPPEKHSTLVHTRMVPKTQ
ncbi:hypothetical protein KC19_11G135100 [Ceratodon purpureus]|uniref:Uncharacterized protein n=1 Tax=Ceratodon purpureus TaxID=3225 RepID=A0A8T0GDK0_CERPU|nr:hypothetical protein KC19_11G135100 [Ceratodon purpureus]